MGRKTREQEYNFSPGSPGTDLFFHALACGNEPILPLYECQWLNMYAPHTIAWRNSAGSADCTDSAEARIRGADSVFDVERDK